jgi:hypothetical protein
MSHCKTCKHWYIEDYCREFSVENQTGYCRGMDAVSIEIHGDATVQINTQALFGCIEHEAKE